MSFPSGFLVVDKPHGVTSFAIVSLVRRLTKVKRVGHAGTLDPLATGVLPVAVGQATRLIEYLDEDHKVYEARIKFGVETDTYDAEGEVVRTGDASKLSAEDVASVLAEFVGEIEQAPPAYSALKVAGKPMYRYARAGVAVEARPRMVRIDAIELRSFRDGEAEVEVRCGKGTYIRSLAYDLGTRLGCGAHLTALRRTRSGGFGIEEAVSRERIAQMAEQGRLEGLLLAPDRALERRDAALLDEAHAQDMREGRRFELMRRKRVSVGELCRAYSLEGDFLGVLRSEAERAWRPAKVLIRGQIPPFDA